MARSKKPPTHWDGPPMVLPPERPGWTRKRVLLPAAAALFLAGIGVGATDGSVDRMKTAWGRAVPTVTATVTAPPAGRAGPVPTVPVVGPTPVKADGKPAAQPRPHAKATPTAHPTASARATPRAKKAPEPKPQADTIGGDGTFLVGERLKPGRYRTAGAADPTAPNCYWARLRGTSGDVSDIIANGTGEGPTTVTLTGTDKAFQSMGCKDWVKVGRP